MTAPHFGSIILGGNVFGWTVSRDDAFTLLDAYLDRGGRAIDTADAYPAWVPGNRGGESEEIIGAWIAARKNRDRVVLATKVAKWPAQRGLSPANIATACEGSLRRLQTDHVDVYFAHEDDPTVEQADYLAAFDALVKAGKVRTLGASNFTPARLTSALEITRARGLAAFEVSQDHWNLVERGIERELVPSSSASTSSRPRSGHSPRASSPASTARAPTSRLHARARHRSTSPTRPTSSSSPTSTRSPTATGSRSPRSPSPGCAPSARSPPRSPARAPSTNSPRCSSK